MACNLCLRRGSCACLEQALGDPATPQSDLYSLGVVLYEMLTGRVPHDAETPIGIAMKHISGQAHPPKEANPNVPKEIDAVTMRLLARQPQDRYRNADELIEDLERVIRGQPPEFAGSQRQDTSTSEGFPPYAFTERAGGSSYATAPSSQRDPARFPPGPPPPALPGGGDAGDGQPRPRSLPSWALAAAGVLVVAVLGLGAFLMWQGLSGSEEENAANAPDSGGSPLEQASTPGYVLARDNSGKLSVEVPSDWSDVDGTTWDFREGKIGLGMVASTDLDAWYRYYRHRLSDGAEDNPNGFQDASGVFFGASERLVRDYPENTENEVLALKEFDYSDTCEYGSRSNYEDGTYTGKFDTWTNCGGSASNRIFLLAATPKDQAHLVMIRVQTRSEADLEAQRHILDTFKVAEDL